MDSNYQLPDIEKKSFVEKHNISPILFAFIVIFIIFILYQVIGGLLTFLMVGAENNKIDKMNITLVRILTGTAQILLILVPTLFLAKLLPDDFKEIFHFKKVSIKIIFLTSIGTLAFQEVLQILLMMQEQIPVPQSIKPMVDEYKQIIEESYKAISYAGNPGELAFVVFIVAFIPALCEEFLFRGLIQHNFINGLGAKRGIILCGTIFGLFHFNPFAIIPLIILGIYFGFLVYRSGSILTSITAHFTNNFFASLTFYFFASEDIIIKKNDINITMEHIPQLFLIFSLSLLLFLITLYLFIRETSKKSLVIK